MPIPVTTLVTPTSTGPTVGDVANRVKRQFGDTANIQIDDSDIISWVTHAMRDIALSNDLFQTIATTAVVTAQAEYALPTDILTLRSIRYNGVKLRALNSSEAEEYLARTDALNHTGTPLVFSIYAGSITLFPTPDSTPATLKIYYTRQLTIPISLTSVIELPIQYHNRIIEYCLQQAYELDDNWQAAGIKGNQFLEGVKDLKVNLTWEERDFYPSVTSLPEDYDHNGW